MTTFVLARNGFHYALDRVVRYRDMGDSVQATLDWVDEYVTFGPGYWRHALEASAPVIPALPGTYLVQPWHDDDGSTGAHEFSIVGWRWFDGDLIPLTTDTVSTIPDPTGVHTVRFPDGRIEAFGEPPFSSMESYLEHYAKLIARKAAAEAIKQAAKQRRAAKPAEEPEQF